MVDTHQAPAQAMGQSIRNAEPNAILELRTQTVYPSGKVQLTDREAQLIWFRGFQIIDYGRNRV